MKKIFLTVWTFSIQLICFSQIDTTDLLLHLKFDNNLNDESVHQIGVDNVGLTFVDDRFGNPYSAIYSARQQSYNSPQSYLSLTNTSIFTNLHDGDFTISGWFKYKSEYNSVYSIGTVFWLGKINLTNLQSVNLAWHNPIHSTIDFSQWNHIAWATDSDSVIEYLNGVPINKIPKSGMITHPSSQNQYILIRSLNVTCDDFMVFRRSLSPDEIRDIYEEDNGLVTGSLSMEKTPGTLFPNPVIDRIVLPDGADEVHIVSAGGQTILTQNSHIIDVYPIQSGHYLLKYRLNGHYHTEKIIVP